MVERGVRFVMLADASWDGHTFLDDNHTQRCKETDQPVAALIKDLKQRGLLDDTLVPRPRIDLPNDWLLCHGRTFHKWRGCDAKDGGEG